MRPTIASAALFFHEITATDIRFLQRRRYPLRLSVGVFLCLPDMIARAFSRLILRLIAACATGHDRQVRREK